MTENIIFRLIVEYHEGRHQNLYDRFREIINEDGFDINQVNCDGKTLLMQLCDFPRCERFAEMLLEKGADVNLTDQYGNTFLHLMALYKHVDNIRTTQLVIEAGADIDCQNQKGLTPLYMACYYRNIPFIYLLLYYEADPNLASSRGLLPINALSPRDGFEIQDPDVMDILFLCTFDRDSCLSLSVLVAAMRRDILLLNKIVECAPKVICDRKGIEYFCLHFKDLRYYHFTVFIENYEDVFQVLLESVDLFELFQDALLYDDINMDQITAILDYLLESRYVFNMIQNSDSRNSVISTYIGYVFPYINDYSEYKEVLHNIYFMLCYGLSVTSEDLETVYVSFGYCELFRILLHMDIVPTDEECNSPLVRLCYNPSLNMDDCLECYDDVSDLLAYFNSFKLKQICLGPSYVALIDRVQGMPKVSSLVELSRNAARKYIMALYNIKQCNEFYCVLNELSIDVYSKGILALQQKLY